MIALKGVIKDGQVILPQRAGLPDGTEVKILPLDPAGPGEDDGPLGPDEIARLLTLIDQVQPFEMTDEERAAWEAECQAQKEWEKAHFTGHAEKLRRTWKMKNGSR